MSQRLPEFRTGSELCKSTLVSRVAFFLLVSAALLLTKPVAAQVSYPARFVGVGPMQAARYTHTSTLLTNGQVLIAGGWDSNQTERYFPENRTFIPGGNLSIPRGKHTATRLLDGRVFIAGGSTATAEFYDSLTDTFRLAAGTLAMPRWDHSAALLANGKVLLSGGGTPTARSELFDPGAETSGFVGSQVFNFHYSASAVLTGSKVLVIGGYGPNSAAIYDPAVADFTPTANVPWWRGTATTLPNGKVLLIGYDYNLGPAADLYDPATGTFTPTGPPLESRVYHTATLLPDGKVLVIGGFAYDGGGAPVRDNVEIYDWVSGTFMRTAQLNTGRAFHAATLLPDGSVLVTGGINNIDAKAPVFNNAEIYIPNGTPSVPSLTLLDASAMEGNSGSNWLTFTVQLSSPSTNPVTAGWSVTYGTAHSWWEFGGFDFVPTSGTVVIPPGTTNGNFSIPVLGDPIHEPDETVNARLNLPTHAWIARSMATGTILNDDSLPAISVDSVSKLEEDTGIAEFVFNITLSAPSLEVVTVDYATIDQTAVAGEDYQTTAGTLVIPSQTTNLMVTVPAIGDLLVEPNETLVLLLTRAHNGTIAAGTGIGTILNDDGFAGQVHHFELSPINATNLQSQKFPVTVVARDYSGNIVSDFTGSIVLSALTTNVVAANLDFESPSLAPWMPLSEASVPGPYAQAVFDTAGDGRASTAFRINAGDGWDGISQEVWLTGGLTYKASVNFGFSLGHSDCSWGHGIVHLQLGGNEAILEIPTLCHSEQGRAPVSLNFTPPTNGYYPLNLVFDRWDSSDPPYYAFADDVRINPLVFGPLALTNFTNGVWTGLLAITQAFSRVTLTVDDDLGHQGASNPFDVVPSTDLSLTGSSEVQGTPPLRTGMNVLFSLMLTNPGPSVASNVVVQYVLPPGASFVSGTNTLGPISNISGVVQCGLGALPPAGTGRISLLVQADLPGTITNVFSASSATEELDGADNALLLTNVIQPPLLTIADAGGNEASAATTGLEFNVSLSGPSGQTISVDYFTVDGTAVGGVDFTAANGTLIISPGTTNAVIRVFPIDDILDEPSRSFSVVLTNAVNIEIADGLAFGIVADDDPAPILTIGNTTVLEGDSATADAVFPVFLSKPAISNVVVTYKTLPGTATAGTDYIPVTNTVLFPPFTTNQTATVQVRGNMVNEPDETFYVALSSPLNATLIQGQDNGTCVILNDDAVPGRLDHFIFDPIVSPQHSNVAFPFTVRAVDFEGTPVRGFNGAASLSAQTDHWLTEKLFDDFEDGDLEGWTNNGGTTLVVSNVNDFAATGAHSVRLTGRSNPGTPAYGLRHSFTGGPPNRVTFYACAGQTNAMAGCLSIINGRAPRLDFYFDAKGNMVVINGNYYTTWPYQPNQWHHIELEFDSVSRKITGRIDGMLAITNIPFSRDPTTGSGHISLFNVDAGTAWFDDIHLFNLNHSNLVVSPASLASFTNGMWSGQAAVSPAAKKVYLAVADSDEHVGESGLFDVLDLVRFGGGQRLTTGLVQLSIFGASSETYVLQASTNLVDWVPILDFICTNQPTLVTDPASLNFGHRFYRVVTRTR